MPVDLDADDDGIPDSAEGDEDSDADGIPNYLDRDSDNDGIFDIVEGGGNDVDGNGVADSLADSDGDGLVDLYDPDSNGDPQPTPDFDGDGKPDYLDRDSDNDGISDLIEGQSGGPFREPLGSDADSDGIDDAFDADTGGYHEPPPDTDRDGSPDYHDIDSDGDGESDSVEAFDFNQDGTPDITPSGIDADGDGIDDAFIGYGNPQMLRGDWRLLPEGGAAQCTERELTRVLRGVGNARGVLVKRGGMFAQRAQACGAGPQTVPLAEMRNLSATLQTLVSSGYGGAVYRCPPGVCTVRSLRQDRARIEGLARKLGAAAKNMKIRAMVACKVPPHQTKPGERRKTSDDYTNDLLKAVRGLPQALTRCP